MRIGYARVSTQDQNLELQLHALKEAGCAKIYQEKISGGKKERPELNRMMESLRPGETVVVWRLDRLGRSLKHLIEIVDELSHMDVNFISLADNIDTSSAQGRLILGIFGSLAEYERELTRERTLAGLQAAKRAGVKLGRPRGLSHQSKRRAKAVANLYKSGNSVSDIRNIIGNISTKTIYNYLAMEGVELRSSK